MTAIQDETRLQVTFKPEISLEKQEEVAEVLAVAIACDYGTQRLSSHFKDMARRTRGDGVRIEFSRTTRHDWSGLRTALREQASKHDCDIEVEFNGLRFTS